MADRRLTVTFIIPATDMATSTLMTVEAIERLENAARRFGWKIEDQKLESE